MLDDEAAKHITVTGFTSEKGLKIPKTKANQYKSKEEVLKKSTVAKNDFNNKFDKAILVFKTKSIERIDEINTKIFELNQKIQSADIEFVSIYNEQIEDFENIKNRIKSRLFDLNIEIE